MKTVIFALLCMVLAPRTYASETKFTLRAADEPTSEKKQWDQGAGLAYQAGEGKSTTQSDLVIKALRSFNYADSAAPGAPPFEGGGTRYTLGGGAYLHKSSGTAVPVDDRGFTLSVNAHRIPGGDAAGPVVDYDGTTSISVGKTLKPGDEANSAIFHDVDSRRVLATAAVYYQPNDNVYLRVTGGGYGDHIGGAFKPTLNGSLRGAQLLAQLSLYPLGLTASDNALGAWGMVPLITIKAQRQVDLAGSGGRQQSGYTLYSAVLSLQLSRLADQPGLVPSLDIKRSTGADLLTGRAKSGQTAIALSLKY